jgi:tight adherence protein B
MAMAFDPLLLVYGGIFVSVLLAVEALFMLAGTDAADRKAVRRRMMNRPASAGTGGPVQLRKGDDGGGLPGFLRALATARAFGRLVRQSGWPVSAGRLLVLMAVAGSAVLFAGMALKNLTAPQAGLLALALSVGGPIIALRTARSRRLKRFTSQLPDAIDMIVRSLRAGHPVNPALQLVADQTLSPIRDEIALVVQETSYGRDLPDALADMAERVGLYDLHYLVVAITIQRQSGGNLAEVLERLSLVLRSRAALHQKARALSAQGRMSAWILGGLPLFVSGMIMLIDPNYFGGVSNDPAFHNAVALAGALLVIGNLLVWRIVNIKI